LRSRGVVLLLHHLDALMQVAAGLQQIVIRFLYFVLRELQLRLGQVERAGGKNASLCTFFSLDFLEGWAILLLLAGSSSRMKSSFFRRECAN